MSNNKKTIIISLVAVLAFIAAVVATSYAYFTKSIQTEGTDPGTSVSTDQISAEFTDGAKLEVTNMLPGDTFEKTFTLENTGNRDIKYKVVIQEVENSFVNKSDVMLTLKENGTTIKTTTFPSATNAISDELTIAAGITKSYTLTITYNNTSSDQTGDMGKTLSGKIFIEAI